MTQPRISRTEWRWVAVFAGLVMLVTCIPYWLAWGQNSRPFSGFFFGIEDGHSYLGKMRLGARGELDFTLFYTPEAHEAEPLVFLPYILPGWIVGRFFDSSDPALTPTLIGVFHLMRILFGALMIAVIYAFAARFLDHVNQRRLALVVAVFGGGLPLLQLALLRDTTPLEMYTPEAFSWLILLGIPHLALARSALLGGLLFLIDAQNQERWIGRALLAALCWIVTGLAVPFYLAILYCIVGAWGLASLVRTRRFPSVLFVRAFVACGLTLPLFFYYAVAFTQNQAFAIWSAQNNLPSPSLLEYLFAYGLLGVLAFVAFFRLRREMEPRFMLLVGWLAAVPFLVYLPINVQRRMSEAVLIPLAILAALTLERLRRGLRITAFIVLCSSSGLLLAFAFLFADDPQGAPPVSPLSVELDAFNWLSANAEPGAVIMTAVDTGNALPAYVDLRVFMGHGPETLFWPEKTSLLEAFYRSTLSDEEILELARHPCAAEFECVGPLRYVFYGPAEQRLAGRATPPRWMERLDATLIYSAVDILDGRVQIYEISAPPG
ncbi:MAG: hypothetical protein IPK19_09325 [Chloroflexi bacterium]|nr:hypothetical protein [Chloroflexota bacterium]